MKWTMNCSQKGILPNRYTVNCFCFTSLTLPSLPGLPFLLATVIPKMGLISTSPSVPSGGKILDARKSKLKLYKNRQKQLKLEQQQMY